MVLWLAVVVALNVLAVVAVVFSVSDRGDGLNGSSPRDDHNPSGQV